MGHDENLDKYDAFVAVGRHNRGRGAVAAWEWQAGATEREVRVESCEPRWAEVHTYSDPISDILIAADFAGFEPVDVMDTAQRSLFHRTYGPNTSDGYDVAWAGARPGLGGIQAHYFDCHDGDRRQDDQAEVYLGSLVIPWWGASAVPDLPSKVKLVWNGWVSAIANGCMGMCFALTRFGAPTPKHCNVHSVSDDPELEELRRGLLAYMYAITTPDGRMTFNYVQDKPTLEMVTPAAAACLRCGAPRADCNDCHSSEG